MTVKSGDESQEDQRMCVVCSRTSPKTIFSCRYKVHERNIEVLQKFFLDKKSLKFGELCDRCYRLWYKHKRQKQKPGATANSSRSSSSRTKSSKENGSVTKEEDVVIPQPSPVMSSSAKKTRSRSLKTQKTRTLRSNTRQQSPFKSGSASSSPVDEDNGEHYDYDVEDDFAEESHRQNAGFSQIIVALSAMSKPPRKSKRKNTPIRSAAKLDPVHEYIRSRSLMLVGSSHEESESSGTSPRSEVDGAAKVLSNSSSPAKGDSHDMDDDEEDEDQQNDDDEPTDRRYEDDEFPMHDEEEMHEMPRMRMVDALQKAIVATQ